MYFPKDRSEVTETWLSDTLSASSRFCDTPIQSVSLTHLGDGLGQLSSLALADVSFEGGLSQQLVIKLHAPVPDMHDIAIRYGYYESEINFYNHLANQVPVRTPNVYACGYDADTERVLVVMESFAHWHSPDQVEGATADEIMLAARELAKITGAYWNSSLRADNPWVRNLASPAFDSFKDDYNGSVPVMLERMGDAMPGCTERMAVAIGNRISEIKAANLECNQALTHWDYRVENLFYRDGEMAVIDWQLMQESNPATDLAYLLSTNIKTKLRREIEKDVISLYMETLQGQGVTNYTRNEFEQDFRLALLTISGIPVIGGASIDMTNPRSVALMHAAGQRMFQAMEDWNVMSVLP